MSATHNVQLEPGWLNQLQEEFEQPYMQDLRKFLVAEKARGKVIYPVGSEYFNALNSTPFDTVRVVILGQDPYHGPGQAHGLCFSVRQGVAPPPSLVNIFKEIQSDLGLVASDFEYGCLHPWAEQGVLLLNSVLTVERHRAASHRGKGWETFTDRVVECLSGVISYVYFCFKRGRKKEPASTRRSTEFLLAPHPSPLSAHRGFFGCKHFKMQ